MDDSLLPNFNYVKNILVLALLSHVLNNFGQASIYCIDFTNIKAVLVKVLNSFECLTSMVPPCNATIPFPSAEPNDKSSCYSSNTHGS